MVLNHSCGQSPMVQMYFDGGGPTANNPWFNRTATHPFNVCYDFNHESAFTKRFSKNVMDFWVNEFRVDGYRFDLSKGFTQVQLRQQRGRLGQLRPVAHQHLERLQQPHAGQPRRHLRHSGALCRKQRGNRAGQRRHDAVGQHERRLQPGRPGPRRQRQLHATATTAPAAGSSPTW